MAQRVLGHLFSKRWRWVTLGVVVICVLLARLGFWQLDRLAQRRATSAQLTSRLSVPPVALTGAGLDGATDPDALAYRRVVVRGTFDYTQEVALVNQVWDGKLGFHLITPLVIAGADRAVLVDRGWVPATAATPAARSQYRAPMPADGAEPVEVVGWIRPAQRGRGAVLPAQVAMPGRLTATLDVSSLQTQVTHRLLPVVVVQLPEPSQRADQGAPPYREAPTPDLGDGVHIIAAIQWFAFSVIGAAGYLIYLARQARAVPSIA